MQSSRISLSEAGVRGILHTDGPGHPTDESGGCEHIMQAYILG